MPLLNNDCWTLVIQYLQDNTFDKNNHLIISDTCSLYNLLCCNRQLFFLVIPILYRDPYGATRYERLSPAGADKLDQLLHRCTGYEHDEWVMVPTTDSMSTAAPSGQQRHPSTESPTFTNYYDYVVRMPAFTISTRVLNSSDGVQRKTSRTWPQYLDCYGSKISEVIVCHGSEVQLLALQEDEYWQHPQNKNHPQQSRQLSLSLSSSLPPPSPSSPSSPLPSPSSSSSSAPPSYCHFAKQLCSMKTFIIRDAQPMVQTSQQATIQFVTSHRQLYPGQLQQVDINSGIQDWTVFVQLQQALQEPKRLRVDVNVFARDIVANGKQSWQGLPSQKVESLILKGSGGGFSKLWLHSFFLTCQTVKYLKIDTIGNENLYSPNSSFTTTIATNQLLESNPVSFTTVFSTSTHHFGSVQDSGVEQEENRIYQQRSDVMERKLWPLLKTVEVRGSTNTMVQTFDHLRHSLTDFHGSRPESWIGFRGNISDDLIWNWELKRLESLKLDFVVPNFLALKRFCPNLTTFELVASYPLLIVSPKWVLPTQLVHLTLGGTAACADVDIESLKYLKNLETLSLSGTPRVGEQFAGLGGLNQQQGMGPNFYATVLDLEDWWFPNLSQVKLSEYWFRIFQAGFLRISPRLESLRLGVVKTQWPTDIQLKTFWCHPKSGQISTVVEAGKTFYPSLKHLTISNCRLLFRAPGGKPARRGLDDEVLFGELFGVVTGNSGINTNDSDKTNSNDIEDEKNRIDSSNSTSGSSPILPCIFPNLQELHLDSIVCGNPTTLQTLTDGIMDSSLPSLRKLYVKTVSTDPKIVMDPKVYQKLSEQEAKRIHLQRKQCVLFDAEFKQYKKMTKQEVEDKEQADRVTASKNSLWGLFSLSRK